MFEGTHLQLIPRVIDPRKFAIQGVTLKGFIPIAELARLADLCINIGSVRADLTFSVEDKREKVVRGQICATLQVQCQRCLEPADLNVICDVNLAITWSEDSARQVPESYDPWVVAEDEADLYSMLEEEVLLNLPFVVYHDYTCIDVNLLGQTPVADAVETVETSPFQVLKLLKDKPKK